MFWQKLTQILLILTINFFNWSQKKLKIRCFSFRPANMQDLRPRIRAFLLKKGSKFGQKNSEIWGIISKFSIKNFTFLNFKCRQFSTFETQEISNVKHLIFYPRKFLIKLNLWIFFFFFYNFGLLVCCSLYKNKSLQSGVLVTSSPFS